MAISSWFIMKNKSHKSILDNEGPKIDPWGTSISMFYQELSEFALIIFVGISDSWQALELSRFNIFWFISDFVISWNQNRYPIDETLDHHEVQISSSQKQFCNLSSRHTNPWAQLTDFSLEFHVYGRHPLLRDRE